MSAAARPALALALATLAGPGAASAQGAGLSGSAELAPFFRALAEAKAGKRARPVHVLQLGDSHSAADHITGALRARLQSRFGEGGRGVLPPGRPFAMYNPRQVDVAQSDGWRLEASFLPASWAKTYKPGDPEMRPGPYGLAGWRLVATRPGATVTVKADPEARFDRAVVCAVAGPRSGALKVGLGADTRAMPLDAATRQPVCRSFPVAAGQTRLELTAEGEGATVLSLGLFRSVGVALSNLGVIGTKLSDFAARDDRTLAAELAAYQPDLIVLAFGTNDGFEPEIDAAAYEALVRRQIARLKRLAPGAAVLLLGAPDAQTIRPDIPMDGEHNKDFGCEPLSAEESRGYARLVAEKSPRLARWYAPPNLAVVRSSQRKAAAAEGVAFWDWQARMGGDCSAHRMAKADPRQVRGDHIHFTSDGAEHIADLLWRDLQDAHTAWRGGA
jgi:lysophospholipase L1-like esterase